MGFATYVLHLLKRRSRHPGTIVVLGFLAVSALGTVLLSTPAAHRSGSEPISVADAAFTATSAVTVTGLAVVDTGQAWSLWGELVILALMQVGGLGVLTMAAFFGISLNRRLGVRGGLLAGAELGLSDHGVLGSMIGPIVRFVAYSELVVAVGLTAGFWASGSYRLAESFHLGVFHAVSAFNNAGFSIIPGGLESHVTDTYINLVVMAAFVIGGIGFPVVFELRQRWRNPHRWTLHTKVTLTVTAFLLIGGTAVLAVIEWTNPATLGQLGVFDRLVAALFQSATARTAGFSTVPMSALRPASLMVIVLLMIIGAGSASTGGGIKVSTAMTVFRSWLAEVQGDGDVAVFNRRIPSLVQRQALALVISSVGAVAGAVIVLSGLNPDMSLADLTFEAASAFGTAGLSTGITVDLDHLSRLVIIGLMFIGRVGPTTFGTAVLLRSRPQGFRYAEEDLMVG